MIYEKIETLLLHYLYKENLKEEIIEFRNQFEAIFDCFRNELRKEVGTKKYELLDEIYMFFDSYEPNEEIRAYEKYCIDEVTLMQKIKMFYIKLKQSEDS